MIYSVQYLRGIAALMVVLHHIEIKAKQHDISALNGFHIGYFGVDLFFIISGFIMCHTTWKKDVTFSKFMSARVKRILPLYWVVTTLALIVFMVMPGVVNSGGGTTSIWASYLLAPTGDRFLVDNGWTLSYEFLFYLIFGASLLLKTHQRGLIIGSIISLLVLAGLIINPKSAWLEFSTNVLLLEFVMGMFAFHVINKFNINRWLASFLIFTGLATLIQQNIYGMIQTPFYRSVYAGLPMLAIFIGIVRFEKTFRDSNNSVFKITEILGNTSYSLYLIHPFVLSPGAMILRKIGLVQWPWVFTAALLGGALLAGWMCYKYVELPLTALTKKNKSSQEKEKKIA